MLYFLILLFAYYVNFYKNINSNVVSQYVVSIYFSGSLFAPLILSYNPYLNVFKYNVTFYNNKVVSPFEILVDNNGNYVNKLSLINGTYTLFIVFEICIEDIS